MNIMLNSLNPDFGHRNENTRAVKFIRWVGIPTLPSWSIDI